MARDAHQGGPVERSFLGDAATRIARLLQLGGPLSPAFERKERILPVMLVGDGTLPGMADARGIQFAGSWNQAGGGAQPVLAGVRFQVDCWLDDLRYRSNTAGTEMSLRWSGPTDAAAVTLAALAQVALVRMDRNQAQQAAPVTSFGSNATATPGAGFGTIFRHIPVANVDIVPLVGDGRGWFMAAGSMLWVVHTIAATVTMTVRGRTF